jgi:hypothetical protein
LIVGCQHGWLCGMVKVAGIRETVIRTVRI